MGYGHSLDLNNIKNLFPITFANYYKVFSKEEIDGVVNLSFEEGKQLIQKKKDALISDIKNFKEHLELFKEQTKKQEKLNEYSEMIGADIDFLIGSYEGKIRKLREISKQLILFQEKNTKQELDVNSFGTYLIDKENLKNNQLLLEIRKQLQDEYSIKYSNLSQTIINSTKHLRKLQQIVEYLSTIDGKNALVNEQLSALNKYLEYINSEENFPSTVQVLRDKSSKEAFKELLENNKRKSGIFAYVISGNDGNNNHWFYLIQDNKYNELNNFMESQIYVYDSGGKTRKSFRDAFIGGDYKLKGVKYIENETTLQTNSGVCEMFAIDGLDLIRFQIFNMLSGKADGKIILNNGKLETIFEIGLSEIAFGKIKKDEKGILYEEQGKLDDVQKQLKGRIKNIENTIFTLESKNLNIRYSYKNTDDIFIKKIIKYFNLSKNYLRTLLELIEKDEDMKSLSPTPSKKQGSEMESLFDILQPSNESFAFRGSPMFLKTLELVQNEFGKIDKLFGKLK